MPCAIHAGGRPRGLERPLRSVRDQGAVRQASWRCPLLEVYCLWTRVWFGTWAGASISSYDRVMQFERLPIGKGSWAGLCPGNNRTAGKNKSSRTTGGNPWLRSSPVECSWAASVKRNCFLREKFWRIVSKSRDHKKGPALIAVAHTLLQLIFQVLSTGKPYAERGLPPMDGAPAKPNHTTSRATAG